ncbi:MAG: alcohol dehydrogenase catalytic domain-containing protein [Acidimicrobiia bacterium]|nr:alcohol dehydrogenase catalytic domain-containing protein [Acidimicrobiia bacterium]
MPRPSEMPVAVYRGKGEITVDRKPVPEPGEGEVLVEVSHCGVCGTDLHVVLEGWGEPGRVGGHEWSGRIAAVGSGVEKWSVGTEVVGGELLACGTCAMCTAGRPSLCAKRAPVTGDGRDGAFAQYIVTAAAGLSPVENGVSLRAAALTEPLAVAMHAITRGGVEAGDRVLVTGAGPIGLLAVAALRARGVDDVVVSEPGASRRERASAVGASHVITPADLVVPPLPMDLVADPFDAVLECSGRADAMEAGLAQLARGGRLVLVGTGMHSPRLDNNRILLNELVVTGAYNYDANGFRNALALLATGALPVDLLIEPEDVPLSGLLNAMHKLASGELPGKVLVVPET